MGSKTPPLLDHQEEETSKTTQQTRPQVFVRFRPSPYFSHHHFQVNLETGELRVRCVPHDKQQQASSYTVQPTVKSSNSKNIRGAGGDAAHFWRFITDGLLFESSQADVYAQVASPMVQRLANGWSGTLLCCGSVGAGKTFSTVGLGGNNYEDRGMIPRALEEVVNLSHKLRDECEVEVHMSFVEICPGNRVVDLLAAVIAQSEQVPGQSQNLPGNFDPLPALCLQHPRGKHPRLEGIVEEILISAQQALQLFLPAFLLSKERDKMLKRPAAATSSILTIRFKRCSLLDSAAKPTDAKLQIVQLSSFGANRPECACVSPAQQKIQSEANMSLVFLEQLLLGALGGRGASAASKNARRRPVPVRACALTSLLATVMDSSSALRILVNVRGEEQFIPYTLSALRMAVRSRLLPYRPKLSVFEDPQAQLAQMRAQLSDLQDDLRLRDNLSSTLSPQLGGVSSVKSAVAPAQLAQIEFQVREFLDGHLAEPDLRSGRQVRAAFFALRTAYREMMEEKDREVQASRAAAALAASQAQAVAPGSSHSQAGGSHHSHHHHPDKKASIRKGPKGTHKGGDPASSSSAGAASGASSAAESTAQAAFAVSVGEVEHKSITLAGGRLGVPAESSALLQLRRSRGRRSRVEEGELGSLTGEDEEAQLHLRMDEEGVSGSWVEWPSEESLRNEFLQDVPMAAVLQAKLEAAEKEANHRNLQTVALYRRVAELKGEEESLQAELRVQQQERYLRGEKYDSSGSVILSEKEKQAIADQKEAENALKEYQKLLQSTQLQFSTAKSTLEMAKEEFQRTFEEFCKQRMKLPMRSEGILKRSMGDLGESSGVSTEEIFLYYSKKFQSQDHRKMSSLWRKTFIPSCCIEQMSALNS